MDEVSGAVRIFRQTRSTGTGTPLPRAPYSICHNKPFIVIQNAAMNFTLPDVATCRAAAAAAGTPKPNEGISIVDPPASAPAAYPICTFTYVIVPKTAAKAQALKAFLTFIYSDGQTLAKSVDFAKLPDSYLPQTRAQIDKITLA